MSFLRSDRTPEDDESTVTRAEHADDHPWSGPYGDNPGPGEPGPVSQAHPWCGPGGDDPPTVSAPDYDGPTIEQDNRTPEERQLGREQAEWNQQVREWLHGHPDRPEHVPEDDNDTPGPLPQTSEQPYNGEFPQPFEIPTFIID
jgi:hypothetical protein